MNWKIILPFFILFGLMVFAYYDLNHKINAPKATAAVVDMEKLYQSFDLTKAMEQKYLELSKGRGSVIDSLNRVITKLQIDVKDQNKAILAKQKLQMAAYTQAGLQQENETIKLELEQQIWAQLNPYLLQFGQQSDYAVILGAMGQGNVVYVDPPVDVTDVAIEFINNKYKGIN